MALEDIRRCLVIRRDNIGALRARRLQQAQRHHFGHHRDQQRALGMGGLGNGGQIEIGRAHV